MAGKFNICDFRSTMSQRGLMKTNKFRVEIPIPRGLTNGVDASLIRDLDMYCDAGTLPMIDLTTTDVRRHGYGAAEKRPVGANFTDVGLRFISDGQGLVWDFFQAWENLIVSYDSTKGPIEQDSFGKSAYEVEYKDMYAVDMNIYVYDDRGREAIKVTLLEAYPTRVEQVPLAWDDNNTVMRIPTMITFRDWHSTPINTPDHLLAVGVANLITRVLRTF